VAASQAMWPVRIERRFLRTRPRHHSLRKGAGRLISAKLPIGVAVPGLHSSKRSSKTPRSLNPRSAAGANLLQPRSAEDSGSGGCAADRQSRACLSAASLRGGPESEHCRWSPEGPATVERKTRCGGSGGRPATKTLQNSYKNNSWLRLPDAPRGYYLLETSLNATSNCPARQKPAV
jgi:hypothetical protein